MKTLNQDIKNRTFKPVYLLFGEEAFLVKSYKNRLREAIIGDDTMNLGIFTGKDTDVDQLISLADTLPFFSERRLIIVEDSGLFKRDAGALPDYLSQMPPTTCIIFAESEVDKRSRMYKKVKDLGYPAEFKTQTERELKKWVLQLLSREDIRLTEPVMDYFLSAAGTDMNRIRTELDKLISYLGDRKVLTQEDIDAVCAPQIEGKIFDMTAALAARDRRKAMALYFDLKTLREPPMRILFLISRQYHQLLQARQLSLEGMGREEVSSRLKVPVFAAGRLLSQASRYQENELERAAEACAEADYSVKTGKMSDIMALEMLIVQLQEQ